MRISDWSSDVCSSDLINFPSRNTGLDRIDVQSPADAVCRSAAVFCTRNGSASREARRIPFKSCTSIRTQTWREFSTLHMEWCARLKHGRASSREGGGQYVWIRRVAVSLKNKK